MRFYLYSRMVMCVVDFIKTNCDDRRYRDVKWRRIGGDIHGWFKIRYKIYDG